MKAIVCTKYGPPDVLQYKEIDKPAPKDNEVLIKVFAAAVTVSDCFIRRGKVNLLLWIPMRMYVGFRKPRNPVLGVELAGEIESVGKSIKRFKKGDQVIAFTSKYFGAYAEYCCLPEDGLCMPNESIIVPKPVNLSFEEAATLPTRGTLALYFLQKGNIQNKQKVLIYGASGAIGTFAVQLAKHFGAEVTGVCSTANVELVKTLGADKVIDYTKEDCDNKVERYDLILDAVGKRKSSKLKLLCKKSLTPSGKYVSVDDGVPKIKIDDLHLVNKLAEGGILKPVIDRCFSLEQAADAHRYVDECHKKGNVVIAINKNDQSI